MKINIISLIGPRSIGKTTIGKALAKRLNWDFIELDGVLNKKLKDGIGGYTQKHGWEKFRKEEYKILQSIFKNITKNTIFDTGGGTAVSEQTFSKYNVNLLKKETTIILLLPTKNKNKNLDILFEREEKRKHFKNYSEKELKDKIKEDYEFRVPEMKNVADKIIYLGDLTLSKKINLICEKLKL